MDLEIYYCGLEIGYCNNLCGLSIVMGGGATNYMFLVLAAQDLMRGG